MTLQALVMISEMVNYYRLEGKRLDNVMEELSKKYGYHSDKLYSIYFKGQQGAETMANIMSDLHTNPLKEINGLRVITVEDYLYLTRTIEDNDVEYIENLPSSDAIKFYLEDGSTIAVRPSGTEPKCKFYYGAVSTNSKEEAESKPDILHKALIKILNIEE